MRNFTARRRALSLWLPERAFQELAHYTDERQQVLGALDIARIETDPADQHQQYLGQCRRLDAGDEGCLSFPGLRFETPRSVEVVARGWSMHGEPVTVEGTHLLARAVQHETDHLDGILFVDRLDAERRKEAMRLVREADWGTTRPVVRISPHAGAFGRP